MFNEVLWKKPISNGNDRMINLHFVTSIYILLV